MRRNFARFAESPIGPGLLAGDGGLTLTTSAIGLNLQRMAVSTVAVAAGTHGAEFTLWGDVDLSAAIGVVQDGAPLNATVGTQGIGWRLDTGQVFAGGSLVASGLPAVEKGDTVGVRVLLANNQVEFYKGNALVHMRALSGGSAWRFAVSLAAAEAATLFAAVNAGQWQAAGPAAAAGWLPPEPVLPTVRLADADYLDDEHQRWEGVIDASGIMTVAALGFWPWGGGDPVQGAAAQITVTDVGELDGLAAQDVAGVPVKVRMAEAGGGTDVARLSVDRIETVDDGRKVIHLRDAHDRLDDPANPGQFLPSIPTLAWRTQPMVIGAVASVPYLPANSDGSVGWLADAPVGAVHLVLDRGDPMEPGTWTLDDDGQQLILDQPPVGPMTVDVGAPASLEDALRDLFGRVRESAWSSDDAAAIDAATGYAGIGYYAGDTVNVRQALAAILPSYGAWWWQDGQGVVRFTRVVDPATVDPAFEVGIGDMVGDLTVIPDEAPNLSRRMAYRPNAKMYAPGELVTDLVDVPVWRRAELTAAYRGQVYAGGPLPSRYAHADNNPPIISTFWLPQDAQAEINRVVAMYAQVRSFYTVTLRDMSLAPKPGQVCRLTYPRYGLEDGKRALVRTVERNPATGEVALTLWG